MKTLRAWQSAASNAVCAALDAGESGVLVIAIMGAGKSILMAEICRRRAGRILITVPSRALVEQTSAAISGWLSEPVGRWYSEAKRSERVTVVCDDSLAGHLATHPEPALWIVDEAHKSEAPTLLASAALIPTVPRVGLTATAFRAERNESLRLWSRVVYRYSLADALRDGVLVPWSIRSWDGTGDSSDVDAIVRRMLGEVEGPGVIGALSIDDAETYAAALTADGFPARAIHSRQRRTEHLAAIEALRAGTVRALVHVDMLSEGVDLPWLRWVALRAPIGSRVRFLQTIGRALRSSEGKDRAVFLDPHDLFGTHALSHPEAIGVAIEADPRESGDGEGEGEAAIMPPARAVDAISAWTRQLLGALAAAGLTPPLAADWWRSAAATPRQIETLGRMGRTVGEIPVTERAAISAVLAHPDHLSRGAASDLITILGVISRAAAPLRAERARTGQWSRHRWTWPIPVPPPPPDAVDGLRRHGRPARRGVCAS